MTGRQHLNRQVLGTTAILACTFAAWIWAVFNIRGRQMLVFALVIQLSGLAVAALHHLFLIRCPWCRKRLGHLLFTPFDFSLVKFSACIRSCPHCTTDFEEEL